jgi:hypothetical protein
LLWVGALKFTAYEAEGIQGLIANSPFMSWMYSVMSVRTASMLIGAVEIVAGLMIAARSFRAENFSHRQYYRDWNFSYYAALSSDNAGRVATGLRLSVSVADAGTIYR